MVYFLLCFVFVNIELEGVERVVLGIKGSTIYHKILYWQQETF